VKLSHAADPARTAPYLAEAMVAFPGAVVRAHSAAPTMAAALDVLDARLRRRIDRYVALRRSQQRNGKATHEPGDGQWRHGDVRTQRPERRSIPVYERGLVRHKTFAVGAMTPDEAMDALDLLDHDFLLFVNLNTDADALVWLGPDGPELMDASGSPDAIGERTVTPMRRANEAVRHCSRTQALRELDLDLEPYVFFVDPSTDRASVAYVRFDGHYGIIEPASAS